MCDYSLTIWDTLMPTNYWLFIQNKTVYDIYRLLRDGTGELSFPCVVFVWSCLKVRVYQKHYLKC